MEQDGSDDRRWEFYRCTVDDHPAFIRVDVNLHDTAPDPSRTHCVRVRLFFLEPRENGFPTREEAMPLWDLEVALEAALTDATYAGVLTSEGARSWYFFTADPDATAQRAREVIQEALPRYEVATWSFEDPEWSAYLDFLYPNELGWNYITDSGVLDRLEKDGDDGTRPRPVSWWAHFPTPESRERFVRQIEGLGYRVDERYEDATDEHPCWVRFEHREQLVPARIFARSAELHTAAKASGGTYDGWETEVIAAPPPPAEDR